MIEGYRPGPHRTDPVGVAPAEVVALALRCERLEAVAEAAREFKAAYEENTRCHDGIGWGDDGMRACVEPQKAENRAASHLFAALVAAGATGKAGT